MTNERYALRDHPRDRRHLTRAILSVLCMITAWMLVLVPVGGIAVHPLAHKTVTAPYHGAGVPGVYLYYYGCAVSKAAKPFFHFPTGTGGLHVVASASSCPTTAASVGYAQGLYTAYIDIPSQAGPVSTYANVSYSVTGHVAFVGGTCRSTSSSGNGGCDRLASASLQATTALYDKSTGRYTYSLSTFPTIGLTQFNTTTYTSGNCTNSTSGSAGAFALNGSFSWTVTYGLTMVKSHSYQVVLSFSAGVDADCSVSGSAKLSGCSAAASVDFSSVGRGMKLVSIVET
ncbi:MAG: hypothetical protein L3K19_05995 [Thermoplasmata archaeon]|nr:hypothetical protein [Thermoplasmata archaeon]